MSICKSLLAYYHAKRLKTLRGFMPHEFVCVRWQKNLTHLTLDYTSREKSAWHNDY
jgi:hypothetical protein